MILIHLFRLNVLDVNVLILKQSKKNVPLIPFYMNIVILRFVVNKCD